MLRGTLLVGVQHHNLPVMCASPLCCHLTQKAAYFGEARWCRGRAASLRITSTHFYPVITAVLVGGIFIGVKSNVPLRRILFQTVDHISHGFVNRPLTTYKDGDPPAPCGYLSQGCTTLLENKLSSMSSLNLPSCSPWLFALVLPMPPVDVHPSGLALQHRHNLSHQSHVLLVT